MLNKLIVRNAGRSMKDYLVYLITMSGVAAFMYAFNSLVFSDMVQGMWETALVMVTMIGFVTVFIVLIVAWLINYMVRFMLEKRSREFGTYLLLGMEKKQVSRLYMRENILLGMVSLGAGLLAGTVLQQIVMSVFYHLFSEDYHIQIGTSPWCFLTTVVCYLLCYLFALRRNRKIFRKMSISDLMEMEKTGEAVETGKEKRKQWLFFLSIFYFGVFFYLLFHAAYQVMGVIVAIVLFILAIYFFYQGLAAFLVRYIHKGGRKVYQRDGLFLLRQLASKLRTMRFTMGTLTLLFTAALLGGSIAMMFASYQKEAIQSGIPFDVMVYGEDPEETFAGEKELLEKEGVSVELERIYRIYRDGESHRMNDYLYTHVSNLMGEFTKADGSLDLNAAENGWAVYYDYDTYMSLGDYNALREMLDYKPVTLGADEYLIHLKSRLLRDIDSQTLKGDLEVGGALLHYSDIRTEAFSQNGMNGADYIYVVPDNVAQSLTPYYSVMAVETKEKTATGLQAKLEEEYYHARGRLTETEAEEKVVELEEQEADQKEIDETEEKGESLIGAIGSDQLLSIGTYDVAVQKDLEEQILSIISCITFPLVYISLIFVCVALTILAVQQLSDSAKYRYRYDVLRKMGVSERELKHLVFKQLSMYYLIPVGVSLVLAGVIGIFAGDRFVFYTGAENHAFYYYGISVFIFGSVYLMYFAATYLGFRRNIEQVFVRME